MSYLLYLKRSFTRSPRRHMTLFVVLTCAFLLPLLISIYRDSNAWGTRQHLLTRSAGEAYHIGNATEADVPYFEGIRGLSEPVFRDGTIYLHFLSDEDWKDMEKVTVHENEILKRMEASGNESLLPIAFSYEYAHGISTDPSYLSGQRVLLLVNLLVIQLSVSVVHSAYQSHLKQFSADVGTLHACGAGRRQIAVLFIAEFLAVFLLLFNILTIALQVTGVNEEWGLRVSVSFIEGKGFSAEDMSYVAALEGVKQTRSVYDPEGYVLLSEAPDVVGQLLRIRPYSGIENAKGLLSKYEVAVSRKSESGYGIGDVLRICHSEKCYEPDGTVKQPDSADVTSLTVAVLTDAKPSGWAPDIYVSDELYAEITASEPVKAIEIALTESSMNAQVEAALKMRFTGAEYAVANHQSGAEFLREMSSGVYLLLGYIFAALFLFILIIIYVRLCDYIETCRGIIRSLHILGAPRRMLYISYVRQDAVSAVMAVTAPFLICMPLTALLCAWQKARFTLDGGMLAVYAALSALLFAAYYFPIHRSLRRVMRRL